MPSGRPSIREITYRAALEGRVPGEELSSDLAEQLVTELVGRGMGDGDIAAHTRWSSYTVGRIRDRLGLRPNTGGGGLDATRSW